jgi:hypothetical protein
MIPIPKAVDPTSQMDVQYVSYVGFSIFLALSQPSIGARSLILLLQQSRSFAPVI